LDLVSFLALFAKLLIATESRINKNEKGVAIEVFLADWGKEPKIGKRAGFLYYLNLLLNPATYFLCQNLREDAGHMTNF
jgi:hypothetical protein